MPHKTQYTICTTMMLLTFGLFAGCGSSRPSTYFLLEPSRTLRSLPQAPGKSAAGLVVGVAPVRIPEYLDRRQIVTRTSNAEVHVSDFESWAEPLESSITRFVAVTLEDHPAIRTAMLMPTTVEVKLDRLVMVEITQFDGNLGGSVRLTARALILDANRAPISGPVWFDQMQQSGDVAYSGMIKAMGDLLEQLGQFIGETLEAGR